MLIKSADDKRKRLELFESLQQSSVLDHGQKDWVRQELFRLRQGIAGERDAAHYIDSQFLLVGNQVFRGQPQNQ